MLTFHFRYSWAMTKHVVIHFLGEKFFVYSEAEQRKTLHCQFVPAGGFFPFPPSTNGSSLQGPGFM